MKVKVISRSAEVFTRERSQDLQPVFKNYDPSLRPLEKGVEYVRALNAVKLDKIFARPFIGAMDSHVDAISSMARNPSQLKEIFAGSMDGGYVDFISYPGLFMEIR
ncbi:ddb1- and cul4-associated factor-like protein [Trifolium pratense]|uniref:Ddb1-and cul4-associated factor-like protein n=1 Tax=Trifolium pratense TaxID=57577 RepID=A0A2K3MFN6_TRIPR|nr:ddb1- and cul4-associated factor-like protein [Trifolium pratense]